MTTEIRAIISDMDDTLLNDEGKLSDYTVATLRECIRRGIHVIPASGRTQTSIAPYAAQIGVDCPYIACNGAQLISPDHQVLEEETIPPETAPSFITCKAKASTCRSTGANTSITPRNAPPPSNTAIPPA